MGKCGGAIIKRLFDTVFSALVLQVLLPVFVVIAVWIKLDSRGPVFFRQVRVGQWGREFRILKFRTMLVDAPLKGPQITVGRDPRITRSGHVLRKYKLDEFPQFINVLLGQMSVVGPRPEVPRYVAMYPQQFRDLLLSVRPGVTDTASIEYRDENELLAQSDDPERTYIEEILPAKLAYYESYVRNRSFWGDIKIIAQTFRLAVLRR
jgi:lipopolysaccharide/colanic/teichoic acid biosynthesis glycosyltransferase